MQFTSSSPLGQSISLSQNQLFKIHLPFLHLYSSGGHTLGGVVGGLYSTHLSQQSILAILNNGGKQFPMVGQGFGSQVTLLFQHEQMSHPLFQVLSGSK